MNGYLRKKGKMSVCVMVGKGKRKTQRFGVRAHHNTAYLWGLIRIKELKAFILPQKISTMN